MKKKNLGSALIEFVLIFPMLLMVIIGVIEYGVMFYDKAVITNASREAARYGVALRSPYATTSQITSYATTYTSNRLITFGNSTTPTVTVTYSATPQKFGDKLTVTVTYTYTGLVLFKFIASSKTMNLSATSVMTYE